MAASVLPRVLVSPFAGVWVDRSNRKWLIVVTDLIRCLAVLMVAVGAFQGWIHIWMVFAAGVVLGLCGAKIVVSSRNKESVREALSDLQAKGYAASGISCDVSGPEHLEQLLARAIPLGTGGCLDQQCWAFRRHTVPRGHGANRNRGYRKHKHHRVTGKKSVGINAVPQARIWDLS